MSRKAIPKVKVTDELKAHYKALWLFLRANPAIQYKKLVLGFAIDISTIPPQLEEEFLRLATYKH